MQREYILAQMKEAAEKIKMYIGQLETENHFTHAQAEDFLLQTHKLYRNLSVYEHSLKNGEISGDLQVHLKIMQNVTNIESNVVADKIIEPIKEVKEEIQGETKIDNSSSLRTIDLRIN